MQDKKIPYARCRQRRLRSETFSVCRNILQYTYIILYYIILNVLYYIILYYIILYYIILYYIILYYIILYYIRGQWRPWSLSAHAWRQIRASVSAYGINGSLFCIAHKKDSSWLFYIRDGRFLTYTNVTQSKKYLKTMPWQHWLVACLWI